jgi:S-layer protein
VTAVNNALSSAGTVAGTSYNLTTGIDTITGTAANDTINADATQFTTFDEIDGKGGTDTFQFTILSGGLTTGDNGTVSNVENLNIKSGGGAITANVTGWTGLSSIVVTQSGTKQAVNLHTKATSATITGGAGVNVYDNGTNGAHTLTGVTIDGNITAGATIVSQALTSLSLANTAVGATVTADRAYDGARSLSLSLDTVTGGTISDNTTDSLAINVSGGADSSGITLHAKDATSIAIAAADNLTLTDMRIADNDTHTASLSITGAANVTISAASVKDNLTSINASGSTGKIDLDGFTLDNQTAYTGSAGIDYIVIGSGTTAAISTGAGNDNVTMANAGATITVYPLDGGDGNDTLAMTGDNATNASISDNLSGFEYLLVTSAIDNGSTINLNNLDNISYVIYPNAGTAGDNKTISGLLSGGTIKFEASNRDLTTISVVNPTAGAADTLNLVISSSSARILGTSGSATGDSVVAAGVETINITTDDTATTASGIQHTVVLNADNMSILTVSGDAGINLDNLTGSTKLTSINTSGITTGTVNITTVANDNVTFTGGDTATVISMAAITSSGNTSSVTTGTGADNVTGGAGVDTIITGAGLDNITAGAGADVITAGAGHDWIYGGLGADTMTGGADNDTYYYDNNTDSTSGTSPSSIDTINDFGTYDVIDLSNLAGDNSLPAGGGYISAVTDTADMTWNNDNTTRAYLNSSNGKLYIDTDGNGNQDMVIILTGVTTLDNATNFRWFW